MNAKKAKAIRKFLRAKSINPREDQYVAVERTRRTKSFETGALDANGNPVLAHYQTISYALRPGCGRSAYQGMKHLSSAHA